VDHFVPSFTTGHAGRVGGHCGLGGAEVVKVALVLVGGHRKLGGERGWGGQSSPMSPQVTLGEVGSRDLNGEGDTVRSPIDSTSKRFGSRYVRCLKGLVSDRFSI
jgi:hypothetical protein